MLISADLMEICRPSGDKLPSVASNPTPYANFGVHLKLISGNFGFGTRCPGWDSNPHGITHTILSRTRKPFRHPGLTLIDDNTTKMYSK